MQDFTFVPFEHIEREFTEEQSMADRFLIGVIVRRSQILKSSNGNPYIKWKLSDLNKCNPEFVKAASTKDPALISRLPPSIQEIIKTSS